MKRCLATFLLSVCLFWQSFAHAQNVVAPLSMGTLTAPAPKTNKSFFSDFDLTFIDRFWFAPQSQNNYLSNEAYLTYNFNEHYSVTFVGEYDQQTSYENAPSSDFQDTDIRFTYKYSGKDWNAGGGPLISIPTSHSSQNQREYIGAGLKLFGDVSVGRFNVSISSRYYEYFYENDYYIAESAAPEGKSEPDTQVPSIPATFATIPLMSPEPTYTVNANSYSDTSLIGLFKVTDKLILRNELRYESVGYFDNHNTSIFHDRYGIGYKFAPEFAFWVSQDAAKNPDIEGWWVFDSKFTTTVVSFYFNI